MFLKNCWYVAARSEDIKQTLSARMLLGERLVLYRQQAGKVVALEDACPHRKLPLSKGRLHGDVLECGYHGMRFDGSGNCVLIPTQDRIPPNAGVRAYPVLEKWGLVWVWMGDAAQADESRIIEIDNYGSQDWGLTAGGMLEIDCHYLWVTDNLLDPTHVAWVHKTSFAAPGTDDTPLEIESFDDGVVVSRWILDQPLPPYYAPMVKFEGNCDRLQHYEVRLPSVCINRGIYTPAGTGGDVDKLDGRAYLMTSYNFITPIDEDRTAYFWFQHYNTDAGNAEVAERLNDGAIMAFNEDRESLEAVHLGMNNQTTRNINLGLDAGSLRFRKMLDEAIAAEQGA